MKFLILNVLTYIFIFKSVSANLTTKGTKNRRVLNGALLSSFEKPFVVYITKGIENDDGWMCAGAIVKPKYILTAAACIDQNIPLYVIAGKKTYVRPSEWANGQCIHNHKRKIVKICRPKGYNYNPAEFFDWFYLDIGVAEVDIPYDFNDRSVRMHCDYTPQPIRINYEIRYQSVDRFAFIYGWGHIYGHSRPEDSINYNRGVMRYSNTKLIGRVQCSKVLPIKYHKTISMNSTICTASGHEYDLDFLPLYTDGKDVRKKNMECRRFFNGSNCYNETYSEEDFADEDYNMTDLGASSGRRVITRRPLNAIAAGGLCQGDHGAPLTTFVGSEEILLGVGIAPVYDKQYRCREPSLFTSTFCMSLFLKCVFNEPPILMTRRICHEYTKKEGYYIDEIDKSFNHLDVKKP